MTEPLPNAPLETKEAVSSVPKSPSKLLTEYYGSSVMLLLTFFLLIAFGFLRPMIDDIKQANAETESFLATADHERAYLGSLDGSISAAESIPPYVLEQVVGALPNDPNVPSLLVQLGTAGTKNNVRLTSINFSDVKALPKAASASAGPQALPMDVTIGVTAQNYLDVKRFLADLEASLRLMDVVGISSSGFTGKNDAAFTIQFKTYVFGAASKPPAK